MQLDIPILYIIVVMIVIILICYAVKSYYDENVLLKDKLSKCKCDVNKDEVETMKSVKTKRTFDPVNFDEED